MKDNYDLWVEHDREMERERENLPQCDYCGEEIVEDYFYIVDDEYICSECLGEHFRKATIDYMK